MNKQSSPLVRKLTAYVALSNPEIAILEGFHQHRRSFVDRIDMVYEGQADSSAFIIASGWACSYKILRGGGRQIVDFEIPGDILGLRGALFRTADHSAEPLNQVQASEVKIKALLAAFEACPRLATAILWAVSSDEAIVVERLVSLGRRDAAERVAHLFLELGARLKLVGLATANSYECPLSQYILADALGLSAVHINRVLRQLREDGLMTFRDGTVTFGNLDQLVALAGFDKAYLDYEGPMIK
ncbi:MAG: Crp/Fnr family transcriptional regulator [Sulfitobacter sp.]